MNYLYKTKEELINELQELQQKLNSSNRTYDTAITEAKHAIFAQSENSEVYEQGTTYKENYFG